MKKNKKSIFWFRRDLRLEDNHALWQALANSEEVIPLFIFDVEILDRLEDLYDRRVDFIHRNLTELDNKIKS